MSSPYPDPVTRWFITLSVMAATIMNALDSTIANVALPHIQGSVSASQEEITWVLTSYIVSAAIFTPLTGWMAGRFGRKRLMLVSVVGFTLYYYMIKHLDAGRIALIMLVTPVSALLLGQTLNHERIPGIGWAGIALIGAGLLLYEWQALRQLRRPLIS